MNPKPTPVQPTRQAGPRYRALAAGAAAFAALALGADAAIELPRVLSSHMVLQREMAVPVWGKASPGERITVTFAGLSKTAVADEKGRWSVRLDPLSASAEPRAMTIASATPGTPPVGLEDVVVGEVWLGSGQSNMAMPVGSYVKGDPVLATNAARDWPHLRLISSGWAGWQPATASNNTRFSALLLSFGVPLQQSLDVPVGLLVGAVGGTPSGLWLTEAAYRGDTGCQAVVAQAAAVYDGAKAQQVYSNTLAKWQAAADAAAAGGKRPPSKPTPPAKPGTVIRGSIGMLYEAHIRPFIPFGIRGVLWDQGESGTAVAGVDQYHMMGALIRSWRQDWGQGDFPFLYVQKPSGGGCAWDRSDPVTRLAEAFRLPPPAVPADGSSREMHIRIMEYTNTAMVTSSDLGPGTHPVCKSGYGARAARVALGMAYGRPVEYYGPVYRSHRVDGSRAVIQFSHTGQGLAVAHTNRLCGFALAGSDRVFHWATAVIDGDSVVLTSDAVPQPIAIRYAWSATHPWANLFNQDGQPALPFRTDNWR